MKYYNRCNYNKVTYIGGSKVKSVRKRKRYVSEGVNSECVGLFDFCHVALCL